MNISVRDINWFTDQEVIANFHSPARIVLQAFFTQPEQGPLESMKQFPYIAVLKDSSWESRWEFAEDRLERCSGSSMVCIVNKSVDDPFNGYDDW